MGNEILIFSLDKRFEKLKPGLKKTIEKVLENLGQKNLRLEIYLLTDKKMQLLNLAYRGKNKPTNLLSFSFPIEFPQPGKHRSIGEIYLAPAYIKRKKENLTELALHGLLHLLGFNHQLRRDRIKMQRFEVRISQWLSN